MKANTPMMMINRFARAPLAPACAACGSTNTRSVFENHSFSYGEGSEAVSLEANIPVTSCNACGFEFLDEFANELKHEAVCMHLGVLSPKQIIALRKKYGLTRADFCRLTRIGEATLARWERGALIQNAAYDLYLRLLHDPENLERLRRGFSIEDSARLDLPGKKFLALEDVSSLVAGQRAFRLRKVS
jgi:putative zinc finger/helix-turn-helix YgiT family protein